MLGMHRAGLMARRRLIQILAALIMNPHAGNFFTGKIYRGDLKIFCAPGLNCYSCPAATFACPIGALQAVGGFSFYAAGFLLLVGVILGRAICGFLCPFGLFQELLYKIPARKFKLWQPLIYAKYFVLIVFVLTLPAVLKNAEPTFCEYICPAGTFEAALPLLVTHAEFRNILGELFALKICILATMIFASAIVYRFFCRVLCPLGAIYGLLNSYSFYGLKFEENLCTNCGRCGKICKMGVAPNCKKISAECISCGDCEKICPQGAIRFSFKNSR